MNNRDYILVTGGLGFIGSHCVVDLLEQNYNVVICDNLANSDFDVLNKIKTLCKQTIDKNDIDTVFFDFDIRNKDQMDKIFSTYKISCVIHFAGLKAVAESVKLPMLYYDNNINGTLNLLNTMKKHGCKKIVFSSSATVYGNQEYPVNEECGTGNDITNPYGKTKYMIEQILIDLHSSDKSWSIIVLRYFNPIGAHSSGLIGENPKDVPNNLFPYILKTAIGEYEILKIFGSDYKTEDGTCVRDFIHVEDLTNGHIKALKYLENIKDKNGIIETFNLGTGKGCSVKQLIDTFEKVNKIKINHKYDNRREGDLPVVLADVSKAKLKLDWIAKKTVEDMCKDGYRFISAAII